MDNQTALKYGFWVSLIGGIALAAISILGLISIAYLVNGGLDNLNITINSTVASQIAQLKSDAPALEASFVVSVVASIVIAAAAILMNKSKSNIRRWFTIILIVSLVALLFGGSLLAIIPLIGGVIGIMYKEEAEPKQQAPASQQNEHKSSTRKGHRS